MNMQWESVKKMTEILYQTAVWALGASGITASVLSFQCKNHKKLVILRTLNEFFFGIQYFILGAYTGVAMNFVGCGRNLIFAKMVEKNKNTMGMRIVFSLLFLIFAAYTQAGFKSILVGIAKVLSTVAYGSSNLFLVRNLIFITSSSWLVYNALVGSYTGCLCEALTLGSIVLGVIRIDLPNLRKRV